MVAVRQWELLTLEKLEARRRPGLPGFRRVMPVIENDDGFDRGYL